MFKLHTPNFKKLLKKEQKNIIGSTQKTDKVAKKIKEPEAEHKKTKPKFNILALFKKKKTEEKERRIEYYKKEIKKQKKKKVRIQERRHKLRFYLERAGLAITPESLSKKLFNISVFINLIISAFFRLCFRLGKFLAII